MTDFGGPDQIVAGLRAGTIREQDLSREQVTVVTRHLQQEQARPQMALEEVKRQGRGKFGEQQFDEDLRFVAEKVGNAKSVALRDALLNSDKPADLIRHLANNERELEDISRVSHNPHRLSRALGSIESRWTSNGRVNTSERPEWQSEAVRTKPSAADWAKGNAWETASDVQIDAHLEERRNMKRERGW